MGLSKWQTGMGALGSSWCLDPAVGVALIERHRKGFLHLRDTRVELGPARAAGKIGIPCFVGEDGSLTLDAAQVLQKWGNRC